MQGNKKCPKCGGEMEEGSIGYSGRTAIPLTILKKGDFLGDTIVPFYCVDCEYIELFDEKFLTSPL